MTYSLPKLEKIDVEEARTFVTNVLGGFSDPVLMAISEFMEKDVELEGAYSFEFEPQPELPEILIEGRWKENDSENLMVQLVLGPLNKIDLSLTLLKIDEDHGREIDRREQMFSVSYVGKETPRPTYTSGKVTRFIDFLQEKAISFNEKLEEYRREFTTL